MSSSSEQSDARGDVPDFIFQRERIVSEPSLIPRGPIYGSSTMAAQASMMDELNHTEPHSTRSLGRAQTAQVLMSLNAIKEAELTTKVAWGDQAIKDSHIWVDCSSNDTCYIVEDPYCVDNKRQHHKRTKKKCAACKLVAHLSCIEYLVEERGYTCKPTFRMAKQRLKEVEQRHHFLVKKKWGDKCNACQRGFSRNYGFSVGRDQEAVVCSWCKDAYHMSCFTNTTKIKESRCNLGALQHLIVPNSWVVRVPNEVVKLELQASGSHEANSVDQSLNTSHGRRKRSMHSSRRKHRRKHDRPSLYFTIKPTLTSSQHKPLLVFINPRSGGNQGARLMQTFQWLLNPRQVFDLTNGGPEFGLRMYQDTPNLRILACGGDGTVGWVLSVLDKLEFKPYPPVAVLPLGTGNDLARVFGWGGGYTDEPLEKILTHVEEGTVLDFDRWNLNVQPNPRAEPVAPNDHGKIDVPLHVINNYFSIGADAQVALDFHESREARPDRFDSRLKNKFFYAMQGGKDLVQRKFADLSQHLRVFGDSEELTQKIQSLRSHVILLLNIPRYGSGTLPWGNPNLREHPRLRPQSIHDGYIEVLSFTSYSLATLQIGGTGDRIGQYKSVRIETTRTLPVQIDGEACRLRPSVIEVTHKNSVFMVKKEPPRVVRSSIGYNSVREKIKMSVSKVSEKDYNKLQHDVFALQKAAVFLGLLVSQPDTLLSHMRKEVERLFCKPTNESSSRFLAENWCFLDMASSSTTHADRLYCIQPDQEETLSVRDMLSDGILVLEILEEEKSNDEDLSPATRKRTQTLPTNSSGSQIVSTSSSDSPRRRTSYEMAMATILSPPKNLNIVDPESDETDSDPLSPRFITTPVDTPMSIAGTPFLLDSQQSIVSQQSIASSSSDDVLPLPMLNDGSDSDHNNDEDGHVPKTINVNKALIDASKRGRIHEVKSLVENDGASLMCTDEQGLTPLHHACRHGRKEVVTYLVSKMPKQGLDIVDDVKLQTALHKAAWYGYRSICHTLVEAGASLTRLDYQNNAPDDKARQNGDKELARYLRDREHRQRTFKDDTETAI